MSGIEQGSPSPEAGAALSDLRRVERINGVRVPLGTMTVPELVNLREQTAERLLAVQTDLMVVDDYLFARQQRESGAL